MDQLRPLLSTFQVDMKQLKETSEYLGDCEKAANNLVNEHKTHTEELRLINQVSKELCFLILVNYLKES